MSDSRRAAVTVDVVVVGAGLAGLTAARELRNAGRSVRVLEARSRPGGRTEAAELTTGLTVDLGGTFVSERQTEILELASMAGATVMEAPVEGQTVVFSGWDGRREAPVDSHPAETIELVDALEEMSAAVPLEAPWEAPEAGRLDDQSFASWLSNNASARSELEISKHVEAFMGDPSAFSMLHLCFYARSNGGIRSFFGIGEVHDELLFRGSAHSLAAFLAAELEEHIDYDSQVLSISRGDLGVVVRTTGRTTSAERCILAFPPSLQTTVDFDPPLPPARRQLVRRMPMMSLSRLVLLYDEPFWRTGGFTGRCFTPTFETLDTSPPGGEVGILQVYSWGHMPGESDRVGPAARVRVLDEVGELLGETGRCPRAVVARDWGAEPHSRGCVSTMAPGAWTDFGGALRRPCGRLHWAGTETATEWCGQMEGAIRSGSTGAEEVLALLG